MSALRGKIGRLFARRGLLPLGNKNWVFVVGCYNSGTTLLQRIIGQHARVASMAVEGQTITDLFVEPKDVGLRRLWALDPDRFHLTAANGPNARTARTLARQWAGAMNDPFRPYFLEKSVTNSARLLWLQQQFPRCYFVAVIRDGYAVAEGISRKTGCSLEDSAKQWRVSNEIMLRDLGSITRAVTVTYEALCAAPRSVLPPIFAFLNLGEVPEGVYDTAWHVHGVSSEITNMNHLSYARLTSEGMARIRDVAGAMLDELGYLSQSSS